MEKKIKGLTELTRTTLMPRPLNLRRNSTILHSLHFTFVHIRHAQSIVSWRIIIKKVGAIYGCHIPFCVQNQ